MLALLIAVFTALLFSAPRDTWAMERGRGEDSISAGSHDVPIVSRQQAPLDQSPRRDQSDPAPPRLDFFELQAAAFASWPLPAQSRPHRSHQAHCTRARGPPTVS
ncbi:hypothetical protein [Nannocystis punicea]|uniref:Secreted protein n=1 Tax=Nannocystis punicea TaxID=2995304 RepID=A0ABY7GWN6_9BACT|nr:hypothetical protein [Nannocystis poenicansa]WAS91337.1 hypothetical protein O0S08_34550 [Nannocystis poenicansa]